MINAPIEQIIQREISNLYKDKFIVYNTVAHSFILKFYTQKTKLFQSRVDNVQFTYYIFIIYTLYI